MPRLLALFLILTGCSKQSTSFDLDAGLDTGQQNQDSSTADSSIPTGTAISLRVHAAITWADNEVFFDDVHDFTLWVFDPEADEASPALIAAGGKVASFILNRDGATWTSAAEVQVDFTPADERGGCSTQGPIHYESISIQLTQASSGYTVTGTASGDMRGVGGDVVFASDFTATLSGATETEAPSIVWSTSQPMFHPMDAFNVFFTEPLEASAVAVLTDGTTPIRLTNAGASVSDVGPFIRTYLGEGRAFPWGATMHLEVTGDDLTGIAIDSSPSLVTNLHVESDPGIFDEAMDFEAETVNALLLNGAQIIERSELGLEGEGHVAFIPTGEVALSEKEAATHVPGRMTLRIPIEDVENTIHFQMALYTGPFGTPYFLGRIQGLLPNSDRRVFFETYPTYASPETGSITPFQEVTAPVGSRAIEEGELMLDFYAHSGGCGLLPPPITGIIIDNVVVD